MRELYRTKGMTSGDARAVVDLLAKYSDFFVEIMMVQELGFSLVSLGVSESRALRSASEAARGFVV